MSEHRAHRLTWARLPLFVLLTLIVAIGCGEQATETTSTRDEADRAVFRIEVDAAASTLSGSDDGASARGSFFIEGSNISHDETRGALTVDLRVTNGTDSELPGNVALTFANLFPNGVTILNSDNGMSSSGAQFLLSLPNDDDVWSPEESSLPRTVEFAVAAGQSVGFIARIDAVVDETRGSIGGMVFEDSDADGLMDAEEMGLGGVRIELWFGATLVDGGTTAADGSYRFDDLEPGLYTVRKPMQEGLQATTDHEIQVLLVESEGVVDAFLTADFGCRVLPVAGMPMIEVGDHVHVKGEYDAEGGFVAQIIGFDDEDDENEEHSHGELKGPVTEIDVEGFQVAVMGTWVDFSELHEEDSSEKSGDDGNCPWPAHDLELGQRIRARVHLPEVDDEVLVGYRLQCWNGHRDRIIGSVQALEFDENDNLIGLTVLNTVVDASNAKFEDDDDDEHEDENGEN